MSNEQASANVADIMTPAPRSVDAMEDVRTAGALMHQYGIRHLPVIRSGRPFGVLTEREVELVLAHAPAHLSPPVLAVCSRDPLVVEPEHCVRAVALDLANRRLDSALVVDRGRLVGIVTTVDICRALARMLAAE